MTIIEFTKLPFLEKALLMYSPQVEFIDEHEDRGNLVQIYSFNNFFIEVEINLNTADYQMTPFKRGFNKNVVNHSLKNEALAYGKAA